ncbi:MAG: helix-turn-helix domain-containing protein [Pseudomonadota bacterium]
MSIKIMSAIFENETLGPTQRLIMLALADHADDEGRCYPSIERLCARTGLKDRAVQSNIRALEAAGYVTVKERAGRNGSNLYFVHPHPAADAPPQEMHPAADAPQPRRKCGSDPAADAPKPSGTVIEPSITPLTPLDVLEPIVGLEMATAFIEHRKHLKKPMTVLAAQMLIRKIENHPEPEAVLAESIANGWQGVFPDKVQGGRNDKSPQPNTFAEQAHAAARFRRSPGANRV